MLWIVKLCILFGETGFFRVSFGLILAGNLVDWTLMGAFKHSNGFKSFKVR